MKKILSIIAVALLFSLTAAAQNAKMDSKGNFVAISTQKTSKDSTATGKTFTDRDGKIYPVFSGKKGSFFVPKVSAKSGRYYRMYLKTAK